MCSTRNAEDETHMRWSILAWRRTACVDDSFYIDVRRRLCGPISLYLRCGTTFAMRRSLSWKGFSGTSTRKALKPVASISSEVLRRFVRFGITSFPVGVRRTNPRTESVGFKSGVSGYEAYPAHRRFFETGVWACADLCGGLRRLNGRESDTTHPYNPNGLIRSQFQNPQQTPIDQCPPPA